ncbi:signal peptidase II, partial [Candidatus Ichthyocystis hellenicum]|uniref:signal peptidase II n=3 Tax=Candidatus Ichthyocystis TaxID=2929841 RepID=UPI001585BDFE
MRSTKFSYNLMVIFFVIVLADQLTKYWAISSLSFYHPVYVNDYMNWNLVLNYGAAFGFMNHQDGKQNYLFIAATLLVSLFLLIMMYK